MGWIGTSIRISWPFWNRCSYATGRKLGGLLHGPEKNVLSFLAEIAYRLIPQELLQNRQYSRNSFACHDLH